MVSFKLFAESKGGKEGKSWSRLLAVQKVAENAKSCSKVDDHNLFMPTIPQAYQCKITQSTGMATQMQLKVLFEGKSHGRTFRKKKQQ